jgi:hypothetical protein
MSTRPMTHRTPCRTRPRETLALPDDEPVRAHLRSGPEACDRTPSEVARGTWGRRRSRPASGPLVPSPQKRSSPRPRSSFSFVESGRNVPPRAIYEVKASFVRTLRRECP